MTLHVPLIMIFSADRSLRSRLRSAFAKQSYSSVEVETMDEACRLCATSLPTVVVLNLDSESNAENVVGRLRTDCFAPIVVVADGGRKLSKVAVLDAGADDLLAPLEIDELLARVRALLRHEYREKEEEHYTCGQLTIVPSLRRAMLADEQLDLTPLEFKLLALLARHAGKVLTHKYLLNEVWGAKHVHSTNYLRVFIAGIRRKIEKNPASPVYLLTEKGIGYALALPVPSPNEGPAKTLKMTQIRTGDWRLTHPTNMNTNRTGQKQVVNR